MSEKKISGITKKKNDRSMKDHIIEFCKKYAPKAPIGECLAIANEFQGEYNNNYYNRTMLAILSEAIITNGNGKIHQELRDKFKDNKAVMLALRSVQHCHSWVVCGPVTDGYNRLISEINEDDNIKL